MFEHCEIDYAAVITCVNARRGSAVVTLRCWGPALYEISKIDFEKTKPQKMTFFFFIQPFIQPYSKSSRLHSYGVTWYHHHINTMLYGWVWQPCKITRIWDTGLDVVLCCSPALPGLLEEAEVGSLVTEVEGDIKRFLNHPPAPRKHDQGKLINTIPLLQSLQTSDPTLFEVSNIKKSHMQEIDLLNHAANLTISSETNIVPAEF